MDLRSKFAEEEEEERLALIKPPPPELMKVWQPSKSYRYELRDIIGQMTPSEAYRQQLVTAGKEMRMIQRLEMKWKRNFDVWTRAATIVKAGYRGMKGRRYFKTVKEDLQLKLLQRRCKEQAVDAFYKNDSKLALEIIKNVPKMTKELYIIQFKIFYVTEAYSTCVDTILSYLGI